MLPGPGLHPRRPPLGRAGHDAGYLQENRDAEHIRAGRHSITATLSAFVFKPNVLELAEKSEWKSGSESFSVREPDADEAGTVDYLDGLLKDGRGWHYWMH